MQRKNLNLKKFEFKFNSDAVLMRCNLQVRLWELPTLVSLPKQLANIVSDKTYLPTYLPSINLKSEDELLRQSRVRVVCQCNSIFWQIRVSVKYKKSFVSFKLQPWSNIKSKMFLKI